MEYFSGADVVLMIDSQSEDSDQRRAMPRSGEGGIWRGSSETDMPTLHSEITSPRNGVLRSDLHGSASLSPISSMNSRSPSASPKVHFESSPVNEGGPRYCPKEDNVKGEINGESERKKSGEDDGEVLRCSGRASLKLNRLRTKTRSRLIDPPQPRYENKTATSETAFGSRRRSGPHKWGIIGKNPGMLEKLSEEEEDDPFKDCDLPDEFKRAKWDFLCLFQWLSFLVIVGAFVCSLTIDYFQRKTVWDLHLWKWCLLVLVLFSGRLVSGWAICIVVFFVERNFLLRKKVLYFVYALKKAVQNCLWLGFVLLAWHFLFDKTLERETKSKSLHYVNKILVCLLVGTFIWLVKTFLVKVLASSFHVSTFFDRIQESLFNQYVLETLSGPPLIDIQVPHMKEAGVNIDLKRSSKSGFLHKAGATTPRSGMIGRSGRSMGVRSGITEDNDRTQDEGISIDHLHRFNQKNISAWNMKRLIKIARHGALATLDESFKSAATEDEFVTLIRSEWEAKAAAKKIFENVAQPCAKHITIEDLMRFLREEEALKAMALFEGAQDTNQVNKAALKNWVVNVFRERRALALTLNDTKTAVSKLHRMVNVGVVLVIGVIWLLILGIATTHILLAISSQLLLVVFVFGNTCKTIFESIIFLFVMHPFDVGDRCSVDGVQMVVEEMNILTTVFLRYDNMKIWYPNSVLATKPISNLYRSPDMGDAVEFAIHIATTKEQLDIMKERIRRYVSEKAQYWYPHPMIVVKEVEDMNRMKMIVGLKHKMNHQDIGERWLRRSHLIEEMISIFRDLDIEYRPLPVDVNIRTTTLPALISNRLASTWMT